MATNNGRLRFDLELHANSKDAKKELQELGNMLNELAMKNLKLSLTQDIKEDIKQASKEVGEFSALLTKAVNTDTGKLDLSKLNTSLKAANTDINKVAQSFAALGNDGTMAFASVVKQINAAEVPLRKTNKLIDEMWVSLKNTMKWQISSSVIHGLQSGLSTAYSYAQDLNKSLNDIRIVTGYNTDKMAEFAVEANKAAKALSTTTTTYTNASLIYYQQGLTDQEVLDRTEVTVKMANAAGASAETVSDQLTAVWNNFYDGSKSLEYYADVMTALGAATASSTDEIAEGLEKFAAIADTVGLSYEYAASALATVTATTRQSADVVGTAFKTLFARIQDLELGNTLDDGTTLGTYSQALKTVGVDIKDASGEMKAMDTILDELGAKWDTLSQSTKVALAQTVAGTRQYSQLIALMDNWDYFQENLGVANTSSGTLDKQAEIYAESWEAAQKRVKASAQTLYTTIIDDEFFIKLTDILGKIIDKVTNLINGLGGVKGLLATISTYVLTIGKTKISEELIRLTGPSQKKQAAEMQETKDKANQSLVDISSKGNGRQGAVLSEGYKNINDLQRQMNEKADHLTQAQREVLQVQIDQYEKMVEMVALRQKDIDLLEKSLQKQKQQLLIESEIATQKDLDKTGINDIQGRGNILSMETSRSVPLTQEDIEKINKVKSNFGDKEGLSEELVKALTAAKVTNDPAAEATRLEEFKKALEAVNADLDEKRQVFLSSNTLGTDLAQYKDDAVEMQKILEEVAGGQGFKKGNGSVWKSMNADLKNAIENAAGGKEAFQKLTDEINEQKETIDIDSQAYNDLLEVITKVKALEIGKIQEKNSNLDPEKIELLAKGYNDLAIDTVPAQKAQEDLNKSFGETKKNVDGATTALPAWQEQIVSAASVVSAFISIGTTLSGMLDTINNPDMSGWEKFKTIFTTLLTVIPSFVAVYKTLQGMQLKETAQRIANTLAAKAEQKQLEKTNAEKAKGAGVSQTSALKENAEAVKKVFSSVGNTTKQGLNSIKSGFKSLGSTISKGLTAIKNFFVVYGVAVAALAAAVAIIYGCVKAYQALRDKLNENELAAQRAEAAAENLASAYEEAKNNYNDLINTISSYEDAKDSIGELIRGTAEFQEAIQSANDEALKLLDTYGDIIGSDYTVDSDGLITIGEDSLEAIKQAELDKTQLAQSASIIANQEAREARQKADITALNRDKIKSYEGYTDEDLARSGQGAAVGGAIGAGIAGTALAAAAIGGTAGSVVPGLGTAIGAVVGVAVGALAGAVVGGIGTAVAEGIKNNSETEEEEAAVKQLLEDYQTKGDEVFTDEYLEKLANGNESLAEQLKLNVDSLKELAQEVKANTIATNAENAAMAASILSDNERVQDSQYTDQISMFAGSAYAKATDEAMDKWKNVKMANWLDRGTSEGKEAWAKYAKAMGLDSLDGYEVTDYDKSGSVTYKYKDEDGKTKKKTVTQEEWAAVLAAQDADDATNQAGIRIAEILEQLNESSVSLLTAAKSGDMSSATFGELSNGLSDQIKSLTEDELHELGFEGTKAEILQAIKDQQKASIEDIRNYADVYGGVAGDIINDIIDTNDKTFENISQEALKQYATVLDGLAANGGEDVAEQFNTGLQSIMDKYSGKSSEIMAAANEIDWSLGDDALQEFNYQLLKMGINIDENGDEWQTMVKAMQGVNVSVLDRDLDSIRNQIASIKKLTESIEIGSIISDEDYDTLIKYKAELADMFIMTADGYQYIGGDIANSGSDYAKQKLAQMKEENEIARQMGDYFNRVGWTNGEDEDWYGLANGTDSDSRMSSMANFLAKNMTEEEMDLLGHDADYIKEAANTLIDENATEEQREKAKEKLQEFYGDVLELKKNFDDDVYDDSTAEEIYASTATSLDELNKMVEEGSIAAADWADGQMNAYEKQATYLTNSAMASAETYAELNAAAKEAMENGIVVSQEQYQAALKRLGGEYDSCKVELANYIAAIESGDKVLIQHTEQLLAAAVAAQDLAKAYGLDAEQLDWYIGALKEKGVFQAADDESLTLLATSQLLFDEAVTSTLENYDSWIEALEQGTASGRNQWETVKELQEVYGDLFGLDGSRLSDGFLTNTQNLELMKQAIYGDTEAYSQLLSLVNQDLSGQLAVDNDKIQGLLTESNFSGLSEGYNMAGSQLADNLLEALNDSGMDQAMAEYYLKTLGILADVTGDAGSLVFGSIAKDSSVFSKFNLSSSFDAFEPNKIDLTKYDDVVDRYKEIDDKLSDINREMEQLNKQADRYTGKDKINALKQMNGLLEDEMELTQEKIALTEDEMKTNADYLIRAGEAAGVSFQVDGNGNIANYTEVMEGLYSQLNAAQTNAMADGNVSETEQAVIDAIQEKIDAIIEAMGDYDESKESLKDLQEEALDQLYEWQDNNYEALKLELEFEIEMSEDDLSWLDHQLSLIEDDVFSAADAIGYMGQKVTAYNDISTALSNNMAQLQEQFDSEKISEEAYVEGMKNLQEQSLANAEALRELKTTMEEYYGETVAKANEELEKQKKGYENVTKTLDHYKNIMSILGEDENEEWVNEMLATQTKHAENQLASAKEIYQMYADEEAYWRQQMEAARESGDTELYELYKKNWEAASDAMSEAQDEMLTKTEEWAQSIRDEVENELKNLGSDLEKSLTGGVSFDDLTTAMERKNSLQEEYLTTTNQIYETNKLMRTAESEIAKTSSTVAKNKLKDYVNETKQMQEQGQLSQFELEMQQAKYDLLLAEIALDEAQNSKSTVRLQRDANGNYGYVYTADADKVSAAQQAYEDADNAYYNKALDGANNYAEKYISTMQEMYDEITKIMNDFTLTDEERDEKIRATKEYYYQKLGQYSELYSIAAQSDSRALQEAWSSDWNYMVTDTKSLESAINKYVGSAQSALDTWSAKVEQIKADTGLDETTTALSGLAQQSDDTKDSVSGLVDELDTLFDDVNNAIVDPDFTDLYKSIDDAVEKLETMAAKAREAWRAAMEAVNATSAVSPDTQYTTDLTGGGTNTTGEVGDYNPGDKQESNYVAPEGNYVNLPKTETPKTVTPESTYTKTNTRNTTAKTPVSTAEKWGTITQMIGYAGSQEDAKGFRSWGELSEGLQVSPEIGYVNTPAKYGGKAYAVRVKGQDRTVWVTKTAYDNYIKFDTGGYTGEWGSSGKLAMLHEKELVLNKSQTQDLLSSMELLDRIIQMIDLQAANSQLAGSLSSPSYSGNTNGVLEQNVHIEASFPNATNHSEIEEAFKNLTNLASQYANRK